VEPIPLDEVEAARRRIRDVVVRTPLVRLDVDAPAEIWLKLENLQGTGAFKLRGAANAVLSTDPELAHEGLWKPAQATWQAGLGPK
jgi:threonine dehydratase